MYLRNISTGKISDITPIDETPQWEREGYEWVMGMPDEGFEYDAPIDPKDAISDFFLNLPKDSRKKLRPLVTDGFVALQVGNLASIADILEEASELISTPAELEFLNNVRQTLGIT